MASLMACSSHSRNKAFCAAIAAGVPATMSAATVEYTEIDADNVDSFHFHGEPADFPLTGVIVVPTSAKGATILKGRYRVSETAQLLVPSVVVEELLGFVLELKTFFDANSVLVGLATVLFLALLVALSVRVRERELETLFKIGCARWTVVKLFATELGIVIGAGLVATLALAEVLARAVGAAYGLPVA